MSNFEADMTIIKLVENDESAYILSNDKYHDYWDSEVIRNNRIITHQITNDRIIIPELDINLSY